jgi:ferrous iron transport protein A
MSSKNFVIKIQRAVQHSSNFWNFDMIEKKTVPLAMIGSGKKVKLISVKSGRGLRGRLTAMGLVPNIEFTVISNGSHGPFIIKVKESKIALGRGMANKIMVALEK